MICRIVRWTVSRADDRGQTPPRWAARHAERCPACREQARFMASLRERLAAERPAFLAAVPEFALNEAAWDRAESRDGARDVFGRRPFLRPLPAAAGALIVVAAAAFLVFRPGPRTTSPGPADRAAARAALKSLAAAPEGLGGALTEAESSLENEKRVLERSVVSAVEYLQARLNIKVERRERTKDL
jgi:hypothetical protein